MVCFVNFMYIILYSIYLVLGMFCLSCLLYILWNNIFHIIRKGFWGCFRWYDFCLQLFHSCFFKNGESKTIIGLLLLSLKQHELIRKLNLRFPFHHKQIAGLIYFKQFWHYDIMKWQLWRKVVLSVGLFYRSHFTGLN